MTRLAYEVEKVYIKDIQKGFTVPYLDSEIDLSKKKSKKKSQISLILFKKIIRTYLDIYMNELFFGVRKELYFFLGGKVKLVSNPPMLYKTEKTTTISGYYISLFWFERPFESFWKVIKLRKGKGTNNRITKMEHQLKTLKDITLLPLLSKELEIKKNNDKLYKK